MSSSVSHGRASRLRSLWILTIVAVMSLPACSDEPQPEPTQADTTAQPAASATTTTAPPPTVAANNPCSGHYSCRDYSCRHDHLGAKRTEQIR